MLKNYMKLSIWKTIGIVSSASLASLMLAGVVHAQQDSQASAALEKMAAQLNTNTIATGSYESKENDEEIDGIAVAEAEADGEASYSPRFYHDMGCNALDPLTFFGVVDYGLNNSQFFHWDSVPNILQPVGPRHDDHDIEALDMTLNGCVWGASGDDTDNGAPPTGYLYKVDKTTGTVVPVGDICDADTGEDLVEVDALAFDDTVYPNDPYLLGWAQDVGLFFINKPTSTPNACGTRAGVPANVVCAYNTEPTREPSKNKFNDLVVEDITFGYDDETIYLAIDHAIFKVNPWNCEYTPICMTPYEIEGLEMLPSKVASENGYKEILVVGYHRPDGKPPTGAITALDPTDQTQPLCKFLDIEYPHQLDVEGIVHQTQVEACPSVVGNWQVEMDWNCNGSEDNFLQISFNVDSTWDFVGFPNSGGQWSQEGCDVEAADEFMNPPVIWTGTVEEDANLSGTYSSTDGINGCWTATRSASEASDGIADANSPESLYGEE